MKRRKWLLPRGGRRGIPLIQMRKQHKMHTLTDGQNQSQELPIWITSCFSRFQRDRSLDLNKISLYPQKTISLFLILHPIPMLFLIASILLCWPHLPLLFALRTSPPSMFSANLRQTLFIHFQSSSSAEENHQGEGISVDKRATSELSNNGRRINNRKGNNHHRHRPNQQQCERLSERQKYARLESIGGRNQQFMANSAREASHNFPSLLPRAMEEEEDVNRHTVEEMFLLRQNDDPREELMAIMSGHCGQRCREIRTKLERSLSDEAWGDWTDRMMMDDAVVSLDEGLISGSAALIGRRGCRLERFVPIGNCTEHGFEEAQGSEKLCTACQGIFMLNRNCFPLFVNAVVWLSLIFIFRLKFAYFGFVGDMNCWNAFMIECLDRVMYNRGTTECERWAFEYLEVPVACECYLSKRSVWLEAAPPPGTMGTEEH